MLYLCPTNTTILGRYTPLQNRFANSTAVAATIDAAATAWKAKGAQARDDRVFHIMFSRKICAITVL
jgi:hypothetical protein